MALALDPRSPVVVLIEERAMDLLRSATMGDELTLLCSDHAEAREQAAWRLGQTAADPNGWFLQGFDAATRGKLRRASKEEAYRQKIDPKAHWLDSLRSALLVAAGDVRQLPDGMKLGKRKVRADERVGEGKLDHSVLYALNMFEQRARQLLQFDLPESSGGLVADADDERIAVEPRDIFDREWRMVLRTLVDQVVPSTGRKRGYKIVQAWLWDWPDDRLARHLGMKIPAVKQARRRLFEKFRHARMREEIVTALREANDILPIAPRRRTLSDRITMPVPYVSYAQQPEASTFRFSGEPVCIGLDPEFSEANRMEWRSGGADVCNEPAPRTSALYWRERWRMSRLSPAAAKQLFTGVERERWWRIWLSPTADKQFFMGVRTSTLPASTSISSGGNP